MPRNRSRLLICIILIQIAKTCSNLECSSLSSGGRSSSPAPRVFSYICGVWNPLLSNPAFLQEPEFLQESASAQRAAETHLTFCGRREHTHRLNTHPELHQLTMIFSSSSLPAVRPTEAPLPPPPPSLTKLQSQTWWWVMRPCAVLLQVKGEKHIQLVPTGSLVS